MTGSEPISSPASTATSASSGSRPSTKDLPIIAQPKEGLNCCYCICDQPFNDSDRVAWLLPGCGHSLCDQCVKKNANPRVWPCPICGKQTQLEEHEQLPKNPALLGHVGAFKSEAAPCEFCEENPNPAEHGCVTCNLNYCAKCWEYVHIRAFSWHAKVGCIVRQLACECDAGQAWKASNECAKHPGKTLHLECVDEKCESRGDLLCSRCAKGSKHRKHHLEPIDEIVGQKRRELRQASAQVEQHVAQGQRHLNDMRRFDEELVGNTRATVDAIRQRFAIVRQLLDRQEASLICRVKRLAAAKATSLHRQMERVSSSLSKYFAAIHCAGTAIKQASNMQFVSSFQRHLDFLHVVGGKQLQPAPQDIAHVPVAFEPLPQLGEIDVQQVNRASENLTTELLIEMINTHSPLVHQLPDGIPEGNLSVGARNAFYSLRSVDPMGHPTDGVPELLKKLKRPLSNHGIRLLFALVYSSSGELNFRGNRIGDAGCTAIADALKINSTLTTLDLSHNRVGVAGCMAIADALKINSTLTTLNLSGNYWVGDAGCMAIADALKINSTLTTLHLSYNQVGVAGCTAIFDALKINSTLTTLHLNNNKIGSSMPKATVAVWASRGQLRC